jgi:hypothetical protein
MEAQRMGVRVVEVGARVRDNRLPRAWKPGCFKIAQQEGNGTMSRVDVSGYLRGALAIDNRVTVIAGYGGATWSTKLWHLTHVPTGALIVRCKHRVQAEEIADRLREELPELTDGEAEVTREIGVRAQAVLDETKKEKGVRWAMGLR